MMKRISRIYLSLVVALVMLSLCLTASAQLQPVDVTGPTYDTPNQAFTKINANEAYLDSKINTLDAEGRFTYWPLSGTGTLTAATTMDLASFNLNFINPATINFGTQAAPVSYFQLHTNGMWVSDQGGGGMIMEAYNGGGITGYVEGADVIFRTYNTMYSSPFNELALRDPIAGAGLFNSALTIGIVADIAENNAIKSALTIDRTHSNGTLGANGIGAAIDFRIKNGVSGAANNPGARFSYHLSDVTENSEDGVYTFSLEKAGATTSILTIEGNGTYYTGDLSAANTANPRWIPDKGYVDNAISAGGAGITNTAAANELMKSDGTNATSSQLWSLASGDLQLGSTGFSGSTRTIRAQSNTADVGLTLIGKGVSNTSLKNQSYLEAEVSLIGGPTVADSHGYIAGNGLHEIERKSGSTSAVHPVLTLKGTTSGIPAVGIGTGLEFRTLTSTSNYEITGAIESVVTNTPLGNEYADLVLKNFSQGSQLEALRLISTTGTSRLSTTYVNGFEFVTPVKISSPTTINGNMKVGIYGDGTIDRKFHVEENTSDGTSVMYPIRMTRINNSGNGGVGIGAGIEYELENSTGGYVIATTTESVATDPTASSENFDYVIKNMAAGSLGEKLRVSSTGVVTAQRNGTEVELAPVLKGSASLNFPSTTATAVNTLTITVTGASVGDPCFVGVPAGSVTTTSSYWCWVSAANTVSVRLDTNATEDPAAGTFTVTVLKP